MKDNIKAIWLVFITAIALTITVCSGESINIKNVEALREYLGKQPANSSDKPLKIAMNVNDQLIKNVAEVIRFTDKYISLDLSRSEGLTAIGGEVFKNAKTLTSITLPNSVTIIRNYAFSGCKVLTSIIIPDSVARIGNNAFSDSGLESITIPNGVYTIGVRAFSGCASLASVTIPDSVSRIGNFAFSGCTSLASVTIPDRVSQMGNGAFSGSGLTTVTIPNGITKIDGAFQKCESLASIIIPDSVTNIGALAFYGCSSLESVTMPGGVTSIGSGAFWECASLASITFNSAIPSKDLDSDAFHRLGDLRAKYLAGGAGTYTRQSGGTAWTKQQ
jgi:hypothetical protein